MRVVCDIECNALVNPDTIWLIVCKDIDTGKHYLFRNPTSDLAERKRFHEFAEQVSLWIGHNFLGYDYPVLVRLLQFKHLLPGNDCIDTLIVSKLVDYSRKQGHSLEDYGKEFSVEKQEFKPTDFKNTELLNTQSTLYKTLENYCIRDTEITYLIYTKYLSILKDTKWSKAITLEHKFQLIVNDLENNGFSFNTEKAKDLLNKVTEELSTLDTEILKAFPSRLRLLKEVNPKVTKHGTLSRTDFRFIKDGDLSEYNGGPFCRCTWEQFNPSSHKQIIEVLNTAGWSPIDKTQTHIDTEREINRLKYSNKPKDEVDLIHLSVMMDKLELLRKTGWKVNENNLSTLPTEAPSPARLLAKRILLESRRRTLTEWLSLVQDDGRIHGKFYAIGAWTHRMAHQNPNTANIPREFHEDGSPKLLGREMRQLWRAPRNRLLVGVDAEGIQLRIFAHYIDDEEFTNALVSGKKSNKSDPHSLNQRILGSCCRSRQAAKRFVYALLLGAGIGKLAQILGVSENEARDALGRLLERYTGFAKLKKDIIPLDAKRGWFLGLDGRLVKIPGDSAGERRHLCMSGYLQNGEAIVIKKAALLADEALQEEKKLKHWMFVNIVHDELQSETKNDMKVALKVAEIKADAIKKAGEYFNLRCPMAGSYWNDDTKEYTIGTNWYKTH